MLKHTVQELAESEWDRQAGCCCQGSQRHGSEQPTPVLPSQGEKPTQARLLEVT